jgi:DNA-directed RNA polymerase specialized sigma24 family protein
VALSAFNSVCEGAAEGRFPKLGDRGDLWQLLVHLTAQKAVDQVRHEQRKKRDHRKTVPVNEDSQNGILGREPGPDFAAQMVEECQRLLARLEEEDPELRLRAVALWKMEGYTNEEIADKLKRDVRTVERRLRLIREVWRGEV